MNAFANTPACRACRRGPLPIVLDLGRTALADRLVPADRLEDPDPTFSLRVGFCEPCALLQLVDTTETAFVYDETYPYFTSELPGLSRHFGDAAHALLARLPLGPDSLVLEAASNDGYMLRHFAERGIPVLGVDPAPGPARTAEAAGVPTIVGFYEAALARELVERGIAADLILGNNVLNLVPDPNDFAEACGLLLAPDGEVVLEVPDALETVRHGWYDNIFHQNTTYFSATAIERLFRRAGLVLVDVETIPTFGGSLRVRLARRGEPSDRLAERLASERALGADRLGWYRRFGEVAYAHREKLRALLVDLSRSGRRIAAYGAAGGMATTLLSCLDLPPGVIDFAVDGNPHKHGYYTPGSRLLVSPPSRLVEDPPDDVLLLAWNYADEIVAAQEGYRARGGRFIVPFPEPRFV